MMVKSAISHLQQIKYWAGFGKKHKDEKWFLCTRSIGDTMIFLSKLSEFKKKNPVEKVRLIISENHKPFMEGYKNYIDEYIVKPYDFMCRSTWVGFHDILPHNITYILPSSSYQMLGYKDMSIFDLMNLTLGLESGSSYCKPEFIWDGKEKYYSELGIEKGKFVLISPSASSVKGLSKDLWNRIYTSIEDKGFKIILNYSGHDSNLVQGHTCIDLPLDKTYLLAEDAALYIGLRSGLCDLLGFSDCRMVVIYPDEESRYKYCLDNMPFEKEIKECYISDALEQISSIL